MTILLNIISIGATFNFNKNMCIKSFDKCFFIKKKKFIKIDEYSYFLICKLISSLNPEDKYKLEIRLEFNKNGKVQKIINYNNIANKIYFFFHNLGKNKIQAITSDTKYIENQNLISFEKKNNYVSLHQTDLNQYKKVKQLEYKQYIHKFSKQYQTNIENNADDELEKEDLNNRRSFLDFLSSTNIFIIIILTIISFLLTNNLKYVDMDKMIN